MPLVITILIVAIFLQSTLARLVPEADVIVIVRISDTDYSQTPSDGPMTAQAIVLGALKGGLKKDQSFRFTETAWIGPNYKTGEMRLLFLEPGGPGSWRILSNLYAKTDFFVEQDAIPHLNGNSLTALLETLPAPPSRRVVITRTMMADIQ